MQDMFRLLLPILCLLLIACGNDGKDEFQATPTDGRISNADLIRNPVSESGVTDTVNVAKFDFDEVRFNFGKVKAGEVIKKTFSFTNSGKVPLLITDARSTCGCTVADYPEKPILPGEGSHIVVEFDTKNKSGRQHKPVTLTANTYPASTQVVLVGEVEE